MRAIDLLNGRLKLRHLVLVVAIADQGSVLRAAEHLHLAQPAVTRSLREVEGVLGVDLFTRGPRGVTPTMFGDAFVEHARAVLAELRRAGERITGLADGAVGTVTIGTLLAAPTSCSPGDRGVEAGQAGHHRHRPGGHVRRPGAAPAGRRDRPHPRPPQSDRRPARPAPDHPLRRAGPPRRPPRPSGPVPPRAGPRRPARLPVGAAPRADGAAHRAGAGVPRRGPRTAREPGRVHVGPDRPDAGPRHRHDRRAPRARRPHRRRHRAAPGAAGDRPPPGGVTLPAYRAPTPSARLMLDHLRREAAAITRREPGR